MKLSTVLKSMNIENSVIFVILYALKKSFRNGLKSQTHTNNIRKKNFSNNLIYI